MSDFIKVNYLYNHVRVFHKSKLILFAHGNSNMYFASPVFKAYKKELVGYIENVQVTREEYERICKELGIE